MVQFIMLYIMARLFDSIDEFLKCNHAAEQYFPLVYFETGNEILKCNQLNESH